MAKRPVLCEGLQFVVNMAVLKVFFLLSFCMLVNTENASTQERLLLSSLGLLSRPRPAAPGPVPSVLWKMFRKAEERREAAACTVPEFGVKGNIVRYVQDQGEISSR